MYNDELFSKKKKNFTLTLLVNITFLLRKYANLGLLDVLL